MWPAAEDHGSRCRAGIEVRMADIKRLTAPSILLVEDNPLHVRLVTSMLTEVWPGYEDLYQARRLDSALVHLREDRPDCILLDLVLPDADGLEAVNVLLAANPEIPIVVLSSHDDKEMALRAVGEGAQDYLVKGSVDAWDLARSIEFAIHRHKSRIDVGSGDMLEFRTGRLIPDTSALTPAGLGVVDASGFLRHASEELASLFGRPMGALIGSAVEDLIDPDDIGGWRIAFGGCRLEPETKHNVDLRIRTHDGAELATSATLQAMRGGGGDVDTILLSCFVATDEISDVPGGFAAISD
jgi:CheY-like chemotaxis protein